MAHPQHGMAGTPEYKSWGQIKERRRLCRLNLHPSWEEFSVFLEGVGPRPGEGYRLRRLDTRKGYEPGNVEWAPPSSTPLVELDAENIPDPYKDLLGSTHGKLIVHGVLRSDRRDGKSPRFKLRCSCSCGGSRDVIKSHLGTKITSCRQCSPVKYATGSKHSSFKGHGEIRGAFWNGYKEGAKARGLTFELEIEDAWNIFLAQGGRCALTGVPLTFGPNQKNTLTTASLDRKENGEGYSKQNVQWVHKTVNIMRNTLSIEDFIDWCALVVEHHK